MYQANQGYYLKTINNHTFLLPFGQQIADQKKGIELNSTGTYLWKLLQKKMTLQELIQAVQTHYQIQEDITNDIRSYLDILVNMGIIHHEQIIEQEIKKVRIGKTVIRFFGEKNLLSSNFNAFETHDSTLDTDQNIYIRITPCLNHQNGTVILRNKEMVILENESFYIYLFPTLRNIVEAHMTKDGKNVYLYTIFNTSKENIDNIFHATRAFFLFIAQKKGLFAIHSASILYKNKAWLFSGHSGMGKSTHTKLWYDCFHTPYLNGDLNLIGLEKNKLYAYGLPWCGTSNIYTNKDIELGGIILLGKDTTNHLVFIDQEHQILRIMQRMISPSWNEQMLEQNLNMASKIQKKAKVFTFHCTKHIEAAKKMKEIIDEEYDT